MLNISLQDQKLLVKQSELKKLETNQYLHDVNNDNFQYIKGKFFALDNDDKCKLLNVWSGIFSTVSDVMAFYTGNPSYDFEVNMNEFVKDITTLWFCTMWVERVDNKLRLVYQPAKNYRTSDGLDRISRLYQDDNERIYIYVQTYYPTYIENKLYLSQWYSLIWATEVPLDTIPQTRWLVEQQPTWLSVPALFVVQDSEISLLERIAPLVYAIDRQTVMNHTQYLQNLESFILFKNIKRPQKLINDYESGKRINFSNVWRILNGSDDSSIEFVNNVNSLIDKSIIESDNYIRRISGITTIPIEFLWLKNEEWSIGQWSRALKHWAFIKRIEYIRELIEQWLDRFLELSGISDETYVRPDVIAKSSKELADELKVARDALIISQFNAIKEYGDYSDEEAKQEMALINGETVVEDEEPEEKDIIEKKSLFVTEPADEVI